jgi:hypothetical protein
MRGSNNLSVPLLSVALYSISGCSASLSSFSRHGIGVGSVSCHTLKSLSSSHHRSGRLRYRNNDVNRDDDDDDDDDHINFLFHLRGGQQQQNPSDNNDDDKTTGSYHGNYIFPMETESPAPLAAASTMSATAVPPPPPPPPRPTTAVLAIATSTNSKLSNLQERTGPALLMLGVISLLLKYTGNNGLIGLVLVMQLAMYAESTSVVENYYHRKMMDDTATVAIQGEENGYISFHVQKWWWFATATMMTSGR